MADETPNRRQSSGGRNTVTCHDKRNLAIKAEEMMGFDIMKAGLTQGEDHNDISIYRVQASQDVTALHSPWQKPLNQALNQSGRQQQFAATKLAVLGV